MTGSILIRSRVPLSDLEYVGGGAGRLMYNLSNGLSSKGWDVATITPKISGESGSMSTRDDIDRFYFPYSAAEGKAPIRRMLNSVRYPRKFKDIYSRQNFDIVLDDISHIPYFPAHFLKSSETTNCVFMHTAFFDDCFRYDSTPKALATYLIDKSLPFLNSPNIICAGYSTEERIHNELSYHETDIIHPCISLEDTYSIEKNTKNILHLGRLTKRKNVSVLLKAWKNIESKATDYNLIIAGSGPQKDRLKQLSEKLGISRVEFHGYVSEDKKYELFGESEIFVLPSLMEGYPTVGLEAMASKCLLVGANSFGIRDYVNDDQNGILFDPNSAVDLQKTLLRAISHDSKSMLIENGYQTAQNHTFSQMADQADQVFSRFI